MKQLFLSYLYSRSVDRAKLVLNIQLFLFALRILAMLGLFIISAFYSFSLNLYVCEIQKVVLGSSLGIPY